MRDFFNRLLHLPMKFYIASWTYFLIWRKRTIPKWLREKTIEELQEDIPIGIPEKIRK